MLLHGNTRLLALIGDPVAQARSPAMVNAALERRGAAAQTVLVPLHVPAEGLGAVLAGLRQVRNFAGAVLTMPHKTAALGLIDLPSIAAQRAGAINVLRRDSGAQLSGTLLDGEGFVAGLLATHQPVRGRHAVIAGAGGAASALAFALAQHGCASLRLINRSPAKATALAQRLRIDFPELDIALGWNDAAPVDLLINATSLGMAPLDPLPFTDRQIGSAALVAECVVAPERTALLHRAEQLGKPTHSGLHMLQAQIELMIDFMAPDLARPL